jgi:NADH-quinone oxidoreductase subunit G
MDVCPVGAITTRDYRFKSRPWDNPGVVDTICTLCSKGCNTSVWLKAKPEWARASQLIRMTPRLNPDVNGYWMCDIGRFNYRWIEGDTRVKRPQWSNGGPLDAVPWHDAMFRVRDRLQDAQTASPGSVRFLASAHASIEELFVLRQLVEGLAGPDGRQAVTITWTRSKKPQPPGARFTIHATDAPNVRGAQDLGFGVGAGRDGLPDLDGLRTAVTGGGVKVLYVLDPGPAGTLGDVSWIVEARRSGTLPMLIVQGVVTSALVQAADVVLPGSAFVEKDAVYTNADGRVQAASRAIVPPGEAREDWEILVELGRLLGVALPYETAGQVRAAVAAALQNPRYEDLDRLVFARPVAASHWLQASNPSERWKWDLMYQDLPPVKGHNVQTEGVDLQGTAYIPLKPVT